MTLTILHAEAVEFGQPYLRRLAEAGIAAAPAGAIGQDPLLGHVARVWSYTSPTRGLLYVTEWSPQSGVDAVDMIAVVTTAEPREADWRAIWRAGRDAQLGEC